MYRIFGDSKEMEKADPKGWRKWTETAGGTRKYCISGSQMAIVMGLSPWSTARQLWLTKTGRAEEPAKTNEGQLMMGHLMEGIVADLYAMKTGNKVLEDTNMYQSVEHPWAVANLDRKVVFADGTEGILECKTTSLFKRSSWEGGKLPPYYEAQVRLYMMVLGVERCDVACLASFNPDADFFIVTVMRDEEKEKELIAAGEDFIRMCEEGIEPSLLDTEVELAKKALALEYPDRNYEKGKFIELPYELESFCESYCSLSEKIKEHKNAIKTLENTQEKLSIRFLDALGVAEGGLVEGLNSSYCVTNAIKESKRFDSLKFGKDYPELKDSYMKVTAKKSFEIKKLPATVTT